MKNYNAIPMQVDFRADIRARGIFYWTPLHYAARECQPEVVQALVNRIPKPEDRRSFVNVRDSKGRTPLWLNIINIVNHQECKEQVKTRCRCLQMSVCLSLWPSVRLSPFLSVLMLPKLVADVNKSVMCVCVSFCLSICVTVCPPVLPSVTLFISLSIC